MLPKPLERRERPAPGPDAMSRRIKARLRRIVAWPPLNRPLTNVLQRVLPARVQRHPELARFAPRSGVVEVRLPGGGVLRVHSRGDDEIASHLFWRGWAAHEPETTEVFFDLAGSARVTLDIGAHVGYFALLASRANPAGRVYAFEPHPQVHERLARNVAVNGLSNVACVRLAAGSPAGSAEFFHVKKGIPSVSSLSPQFMHSIFPSDEITSCTVEVVEVDDFVQEHRIEGVDLVKVDTETTEAAVFRGMLRTLRRDRPTIICEVLEDAVAADLEALLAPLGYEFHLLTPDGPVRQDHIRPDAVLRNFMFRAVVAR